MKRPVTLVQRRAERLATRAAETAFAASPAGGVENAGEVRHRSPEDVEVLTLVQVAGGGQSERLLEGGEERTLVSHQVRQVRATRQRFEARECPNDLQRRGQLMLLLLLEGVGS